MAEQEWSPRKANGARWVLVGQWDPGVKVLAVVFITMKHTQPSGMGKTL